MNNQVNPYELLKESVSKSQSFNYDDLINSNCVFFDGNKTWEIEDGKIIYYSERGK